jgi:predicted XRE-type DNA-binding protein
MSEERFASVWNAVADTPAEAENMKLRSHLMKALREQIAREGLRQVQAAKLLGVTQPRVSDLMRGKIELFAIDSPVNMRPRPDFRSSCASPGPPETEGMPRRRNPETGTRGRGAGATTA